MKIFALARRFVLRPLRKEKLRSGLTILSVALGVAVVIAVDLAGDAATGSFQSSMTSLVGRVDYEVTANGGVNERVIAKLTALPVNATFAAVIEQPVTAGRKESLSMFGVEALTDPSVAVVSDEAAARFAWKTGDSVELRGQDRTGTFRIQKVVAGQNVSWIAVDIAAAQQLLGRFGTIDRIEISLAEGENAAGIEKLVRSALPSSYDVATAGARREENQRMLRAFRWNLRILSYISLLVGAFLIYNTIAVSVVRRRAEIGILRAVGVSAGGVLAIFLGEAAMLGVAGSLAGIVLGRLLAAGIVGMISDTVNSLFITSAPGAVTVSGTSAAWAVATGTSVAVVSALIPAREAARVAPAEAMRIEAREHTARLNLRRDLAIAILAIASAITASRFGPVGGRPLWGYISALCAVAAAALISPAFVSAGIHALRVPLSRIPGAAGLIAGRSLSASLARTSIVVTALATAISMTISVGIMVASFRETVQVWLESQLRADIYLRAGGQPTAGIFPPLAPEVAEIISRTPGVADVDVFHAFTFEYEGQQATFGAGVSDIVRRKGTLRFLEGSADAILSSLPGRDRVVVSEPFANKHNVRVGDVLKIPLGAQIAALTVAGIYYDYSSDRGFVISDNTTLLKFLPGPGEPPATDIAVYVASGADAGVVRRALESRLSGFPVAIAPNEALRRGAVEVFDRTFAVTWALEAVAIIVAMLGAANSLLALVLDRRREIGLIRYLGADDRQIRRMVLTEAGLVGLLAAGLGLLLGAALSLDLIYVINKQSFGWTIRFHLPLALLAGALLLVWFFTIAAGVYPARFAARLQPADAVHEE
jgi:putative ABC transport system permease protein